MKTIYIVFLLLIAALFSGCVDQEEQNISTVPPGEIVNQKERNLPTVPPGEIADKKEQNISTMPPGEILPESYVSEVEGNLTQIESTLNEMEENFSTGISESAFD